MSQEPQGAFLVSPTPAVDSARGVSPAAAVSPAFHDTLRLLFAPFSLRRWIKLGLVCLFLGGGTLTPAFHWSLAFLASETEFGDPLEQARQYVAQHLWLILIAMALGIALGVVLIYLRAIFRFVLVDAIFKQELVLSRAWTEVQSPGRSYFLWLLSALLGVGAAFAVAVVTTFPYLRAGAATPSLGSRLTLLSVLLGVVLLGLLFALAITLTDDLAIPIMYAERLPLLTAWQKLWNTLRAEAGVFMVYVLLRFALSVALGAAVLFFLFPALISLFAGAFMARALVVWALEAVGIVWMGHAFTLILTAVAGVVLTALLFVLLSVAGMPSQVLLQAFGMRFISSRVPALQVLWRGPHPLDRQR